MQIRRILTTLAVVFSLTVVPAAGQEESDSKARAEAEARAFEAVQTLLIRNGQVQINGRIVQPADLHAEDVINTMTWTWSTQAPVVEVGGSLYSVALVPQTPFNRFQAPMLTSKSQLIFDTEQGTVYSLTGEELDRDEAAQQLVRGTDNLYLSRLQRQNNALFRELSNEQQLEGRAQDLGYRIQVMRPTSERRQQIDELEVLLGRIFDLKTDNRRKEIAFLEARLAKLRSGLAERERLKNEMIEQRLRYLIGLTADSQKPKP